MLKIYISGKITGLDNFMDLFRLAEIELKQLGYKVCNPALLPHDHDHTWQSYMREDICHLMKCKGIYMLSNWKRSKGARIEWIIAYLLNYKIMYQ